ncbi:MAG: cob(I)yrinic acid a,c-diamide adenosyltransferase [SAR324 cluster bacterium]|nr:cob(I)yrinic acid a,c-diamide adenosyltransferase [SAR324 cluster bacterium]
MSKEKETNQKRGIVLVTCGDGKGKSTAGFGMVFRSAGWGKRVLVIQFIKGKWGTGEEKAAKAFDNIEWHSLGDGFTWDTKNPEQDKKTAEEAWEFAQKKILSGHYDLVFLDEINYCMGYGWLDGGQVVKFINEIKPPEVSLILSGRNPSLEVLEVADTVTEMTLKKHAYKSGIKAKKGIEF